MSFYDDWLEVIENKEDDLDYLEAFLKEKDFTIKPFINGDKEQIEKICNILINYDFDKIVELINEDYITELTPSKILQFSNLENGIYHLPRILYNNNEGLSYLDIGKKLANSIKFGAAVKYGENHSKLAHYFNLVHFTKTKPTKSKITKFGESFIFLDQQTKLIKVLGLRNPVIRNLIARAKQDITYYDEVCNCLSKTTKNRRRSNVKKVFKLIFNGKNYNFINNIIW